MKNFLLCAALLSMTVSAALATEAVNLPMMKSASAMKALPIYSNTIISEAPAGEVVTGIRDSYSCYYQGGDHYRDFENGVIGQYVIGEDDCVYLRGVCYAATKISKETDTYLKLEKVDDTTYVAHTPQLIWVDTLDDDYPFTAYATRLGFSQLSSSSFTYSLQEDESGYMTDVYFTLEDGTLKQKNENTVDMNGELFPEELIGFTDSSGNWIGFGGGCISISKDASLPTMLPDDARPVEKSLDFDILHVRDIVIDNAVMVKYAEVGDEIYISNPSSGTEQWIKGVIDRENETVTFLPQYLGMDDVNGYAVWFIPAVFDKYLEVFNDETGAGDWFRTYTASEKSVFKIEDGKLLPTEENQALFFSHSPEQLLETGVYADPSITFYENASLTPSSVTVTKFESYDEFWGFGVVGFGIPCMSVDGSYINPDELYYNFYIDDDTEPYLFTSNVYIDMEGSMTNVPYGYFEDFDFKVNGVNHTVYFFADWKKIGIQVVQIHDGMTTRSETVYTDGSVSGVNEMPSLNPKKSGSYKYINDGELRIVREGVEYNALGYPVR